jgi:ribosomal protein L17
MSVITDLLNEFNQEPVKSSEKHRVALLSQLKSLLTEKEHERLSRARGDSLRYDVEQLIIKY